MASKDYFQAELDKIYPTTNSMADASLHDGKIKCLQYFDRFSKSIELFRHGGFATVDEFSKLASESYPEHVQAMKKLMCFVLAAHNPEKNFHDSDYYAFIQRLFRNDALNHFRNEITVITFNYDCYLDYVMRQAYSYRSAVSKVSEVVKNHPDVLKGPQPLTEPWSSKLSSGFFNQESDKTLAWRTDQFNYYKLHGSVAYGEENHYGYDTMLAKTAQEQ